VSYAIHTFEVMAFIYRVFVSLLCVRTVRGQLRQVTAEEYNSEVLMTVIGD